MHIITWHRLKCGPLAWQNGMKRIAIWATFAMLGSPIGFAAPANAAEAQTSSSASAFGVKYDPSVGESLYAAHCAACHDHPTGRVPAKAVIGANTAFEIFYVLNNGIMRPYAVGLSGSERVSIAEYLSENKTGDQTTQSLSGAEAPKCAAEPPPLDLAAADWNGWGRDVQNTRYQPAPGLLSSDLARLKLKWAMAVSANRNGQPVVAGGRVFTNDSSRSVYSLDAKSGCAYWHFSAQVATRNTIFLAPLADSKLPNRIGAFFVDGDGDLYALDARLGTLIWRTHIDAQPGHQFTGSVTAYGGVIYAPVSSAEEAFATNDAYTCCKFRGALIAVEADTGKIRWSTYTSKVQAKPFKKNRAGMQMYGPAGGAIWSAPTIDSKRGLVYIATGNSYTDIPYDGAESIMALAMKTGKIVWQNRLTARDTFIDGCFGPQEQHPVNCPTTVGGDYDFGASPALVTLPSGKQIIVVSQKSSQVYALDPDAQGKVIWERRLSGGGPLGGSEWGHAVDGENVYVGISDIYKQEAARPQLTALKLSDGLPVWSQALAKRSCRWNNAYCNPGISMAVTAMPGAVFAGRMDGLLNAYAAADGEILWSFDTTQTFTTITGTTATGGVLDSSGPVIAGGMLYVHSGYAGRSGQGSVLLAFSVDGK